MNSRIEQTINTGWFFTEGDHSFDTLPDAHSPSWEMVRLPHDFSIGKSFNEQVPAGASGGFLPGGRGWYRKELDIPREYTGKKVSVEFDGVMANSKVRINGNLLGERPSGYIGFRYDITPFIRPGGRNTLVVMADTSRQPASRWYTGSGIYRDARLIVTDPVHVPHRGTYVTCHAISESSAAVRLRTEIVNDSEESRTVSLETTLVGPAGAEAGSDRKGMTFGPGERKKLEQEMIVENPELWSDSSPELYTARSAIREEGRELDSFVTRFGIRTVEFDADTGFLINGVRKKLKGMCIHHDLGPLGAALNNHVLKSRLLSLKEMGCNAIRCAHNPYSPSFYSLCDELGLYVIDEFFDEWRMGKREYTYHRFFDEWWERDLTDQVRQNRNHPSIILWSIGNEIPERGTEEGVETARMLRDRIHELEPSRPVTSGVNCIGQANRSGFAGALDVVGYNGGGDSVFQYDEDKKAYPRRKMYGSEVPHTFATRGIYRTTTRFRDQGKPGFENMMTTHVPDLTDEEVFDHVPDHYYSSYDNSLVRISSQQSWRLIRERDFMAGEFRWTGFDYLGESLGWPAKYFQGGVMDLCGFKKDLYYLYQAMWTDAPMAHILPHWTHPGKEGVEIPVCVFSNCDAMELFFNGESLGVKKRGSRHDLFWYLPYKPGELRAAGYSNGVRVCEDRQRTAGKAYRIAAEPDKTALVADGYDVCQLSVRILDEDGILVPAAGNIVTFELTGDAEMIAVANGDPASDQPFQAERRSAFNGMCYAVIQSGLSSGAVAVTCSSPGLVSAGIELAMHDTPAVSGQT